MSYNESENVSLKRCLDEQYPDRKLRKLDIIHIFGDTDVAVIVDKKENVWFRATDVARAIDMMNPSTSISENVDNEDSKNYEELALLNEKYSHIPDIHPKTTFINETGMNAFIMKSRKPKAAAFSRWVCGEVLPSIRKTNRYEIDPNDNPYRRLNEQIQELLTRNRELESKNEVVTSQNNRMKLDIESCVKKLFSMKAQNVPILEDPRKSEYLIVYRKHKIDDEWNEDLPYYACRVQRSSEKKAHAILKERYSSLEEVTRFAVPNSVNFFNNMKEDLKPFIEWCCNSFKLRDVSEDGMKTVLEDFHEQLYGDSKAQSFLDALLNDETTTGDDSD